MSLTDNASGRCRLFRFSPRSADIQPMPGRIFPYLLPDTSFISARGMTEERNTFPRLSPYRSGNTMTAVSSCKPGCGSSHALLSPFRLAAHPAFCRMMHVSSGKRRLLLRQREAFPLRFPSPRFTAPSRKKSPEDETPGFAENIPQGHTEKYGRIMRASCRAFVPACAPATPRSRKPEDTWPR